MKRQFAIPNITDIDTPRKKAKRCTVPVDAPQESSTKITNFFGNNEANRNVECKFETSIDNDRQSSSKISTESSDAYIISEKPSKRKKGKPLAKINKRSITKIKVFKRLKDCESKEYAIKDLLLKQEDVNILSKEQYLNSGHIYAAMVLLKKQFPKLCGLLATAKKQAMVDAKQNSIQFHHDGNNHWLLSSNISGKVLVYDSIYRKPSKDTEKQLCQFYKRHVKNLKLEVEYPLVQRQIGGFDCDLFAIAFAVDLATDHDPTKIFYDQNEMRSHLLDSFYDGKLTVFPRSDWFHFSREVDVKCYEINVSCLCGLPNVAEMINCSMCERRFHDYYITGFSNLLDWECDDCKPPV